MKVATIVGTRPEIIRLSRVLAALDRYVEHVLIHTGQNYDYELNQIFFDDLEIRKPDFFLEAAGRVLGEAGAVAVAEGLDRLETMEAVTDCDVLEASTPHLDDVVRLTDRYGREGTSAP